jgi:hypothetical protein
LYPFYIFDLLHLTLQNIISLLSEYSTSIMAVEEHKLSQEQIDHFLEHGWIKLSGCFSREQSAELQSQLWTRLGMDPNDMSTW